MHLIDFPLDFLVSSCISLYFLWISCVFLYISMIFPSEARLGIMKDLRLEAGWEDAGWKEADWRLWVCLAGAR